MAINKDFGDIKVPLQSSKEETIKKILASVEEKLREEPTESFAKNSEFAMNIKQHFKTGHGP
jgi:hypothetical protein